MSENSTPFSTRQMYLLGSGDEERCEYDFSILPYEDYNKFFYALPNILYKRLKSVHFTCSFFYDYRRDGRHSRKRELVIADSIFYHRPKYIRYLIKILSQVLPKSKTLVELEISDIKINPKLLDKLFTAIGNSPQIKSIKFSEVPIGDELFKKLLSHLTPIQIESLNLNNTSLTPKSLRNVNKFIERKSAAGNANSIKNIEITQDDFPNQMKTVKRKVKQTKNVDDDWDSNPQWQTHDMPVTEGITFDTVDTTKENKTSTQEDHVIVTSPSKDAPNKVDSEDDNSDYDYNSGADPAVNTVSMPGSKDNTHTIPSSKDTTQTIPSPKDTTQTLPTSPKEDTYTKSTLVEETYTKPSLVEETYTKPSLLDDTYTKPESQEQYVKDTASTSTADPERNMIIQKLMEETLIEANKAVDDASLIGKKTITAEGTSEAISIEEVAINAVDHSSEEINERDLFLDSENHDESNLKVTDSDDQDNVEEEEEDITEIIEQYEDVYTFVTENETSTRGSNAN